jgi:hypothetical protein
MEEKLRSIRWRQITMAVLRALAIGLSVLIAAMIVAMIIDWSMMLFSTTVRTALTAGSLTLAVAALLWAGVPRLNAALGRTRAATDADEVVPQLEERWTTVASFAVSEHQPATSTGRAMLQQVTSEAVAMGRLVEPQQVARPTALRPSVLALGGCGLLLAGFLAINWPQTSVLLQRFWSPATNITATQLASVTGDLTVPRGEAVELVTQLTGLARESALLTVQNESGVVDVFELKPDDQQPEAFVHAMYADDSFQYRVRSGDGQSEWHSVTVIDYPAFSEVQLTVTAPEYTDRPPYEKNVIPRRIRVVQGSLLQLRMKPVEALERLELNFELNLAGHETEERQLVLSPEADGWYRFETPLVEDMSFSPALFSSHGLTNEEKQSCRIQVIADKAPVARVLSPTEETAVAFDDVVEIQFEAHDDHGIAMAELVVYEETEDGEEPKITSVQEIPLGDQMLQKHVTGTTELDLKKLDLEEGASISYAVRVTDNRMLQIDPESMVAQHSEARPGQESDDAEMSAADGETSDERMEAEAGSDEDRGGDNPLDDAGNMLADAGAIQKEAQERLDEGSSAEASEGDRSEGTAKDNDRSATGSSNKQPSANGEESETADGTKSDSGERDADEAATSDSAESSKQTASAGRQTDKNSSDGRTSESNPEPADGESSKADRDSEAAAEGAMPADADQSGSQTSDSESSRNATSRVGSGDEKSSSEPEGDQKDGEAADGRMEEGDSESSGSKSQDSESSEPVIVQNEASQDGDREAGRSEPGGLDSKNSESENEAAEGPAMAAADERNQDGEAVAQNGEMRDRDGDAASEATPDDSSADSQSDRQNLAAAGERNPSEEGREEASSNSGNQNRDSQTADGKPSKNQSTTDRDTDNMKQMLAAANADRNEPSDSSGNSANANPKPQNSDKPSEPRTGEQQRQPREPSAPQRPVALNPQRSESGQNVETNRRRLKITERLSAVARSEERKTQNMQIRDRVVEIDKLLALAEEGLTRIVEREIPDADRSEQFRILDVQLGDVETYVAELREETKDHQFAFVGLQMVDISRTHVTPARDRVFVAIREPIGAESNSVDALQHVVRARELLAALLKRYDRVAQDRELAESLDEAVTMYEVYVERMQQLMREARQNRNPLDRKMGVIEVDQDYLDRFAEVLTLRREMMDEFGRILADDPRLLARYMDLIKRRQSSLVDQLSELAERQYEISTEVSGWLAVDESQRDNLWMLIVEMRLQTATDLAKDCADFAERVEKQLPLVLEASEGSAALVVQHAQRIAGLSREIAFEMGRAVEDIEQIDQQSRLLTTAEQLVYEFGELDAALDLLNFAHEDEDEVTAYVDARLLESRTVTDRADEWAQFVKHIINRRYGGLAEVDQQKVAIATELLRVEMLGIETDLNGQFGRQTDGDAPGTIRDLVRELQRVMESITFSQSAAVFAMTNDQLDRAEMMQLRAMEGFEKAEKLFDRIRREVVAALDEYDMPDPNIADLRDPTLDEFLAQLEREPNIEAQLGIPNRPRNLRLIADTMTWQQNGAGALGDSQAAARARAEQAMKMQRNSSAKDRQEEQGEQRQMTDEERQQLAEAKDMQEMLEKSLASIEEKAKDPAITPEQRRKLEQMAANMKRMLGEAGNRHDPTDEEWERIAEADQAKEILRALARGEAIPDQQWNRLLSTLDDGLWQVRGRTPPEDYRKAIEQYQDRIRQLMNTIEDDE